ncbi:MAG: hypothetical protein QHH00_03775 [Methanomassiliicoccales archaeon]|nr:hypothetical protein [Methanomassiliicoccales archaeon]
MEAQELIRCGLAAAAMPVKYVRLEKMADAWVVRRKTSRHLYADSFSVLNQKDLRPAFSARTV